jgi:hypothetical protein
LLDLEGLKCPAITMAEQSSTKRARSNTIGDAHIKPDSDEVIEVPAPQVSAEEVSRRIKQLDSRSVADILQLAAQTHPDVLGMIDDAIRVIQERKRNRVIDFDHHSKSIWKSINVTYKSMRGAKQYDISGDVAMSVISTIELITRQCGPSTNPQTRFNGLSVLRKIGKTIALSSTDTLGHEVQKWFQSDASLTKGMLKILHSMETGEIKALRDDESSPEALWPKLKELEELSRDYCIHPGFEKVLNLLDGADDEDEEDFEKETDEEVYENFEERDHYPPSEYDFDEDSDGQGFYYM